MSGRLIAFLALLGSVVGAPPQSGWRHFQSTENRYIAFYPPGWRMLTPGSQFLEVVNFPRSEQVEGEILPQAGAFISAGPAEKQDESITDLIQGQLASFGAQATLDQTLLTGSPYPDACKTLRQVEFDFNIGDARTPVFQHWTFFYCSVSDRKFDVALNYFVGNKDAAMLNALALTVARSLRIGK